MGQSDGYADFGKRAAAAIIDAFVLAIPAILISLSLTALEPAIGLRIQDWPGLLLTFFWDAIFVLLMPLRLILMIMLGLSSVHIMVVIANFWVAFIIANWLYHALLESSVKQATVGKMMLKLRVTGSADQRISFWQATLRHFSKMLSTVILCIGFLMALWTPRKQTLHDTIARCFVRTAADAAVGADTI